VVGRGRVIALASMGASLGGVIPPIVVTQVVDRQGWEAGWVVLGIATMVLIFPTALVMRRQPEDYGLEIDGRSTIREEGMAPAEKELSWTLAEARRTKAFWLLVFFTVCTPFVQGATNLHLVANFQDQGLSDVAAISVLSIFAWSSALSIMPMGLLLDHVHVRFGGMLQAIVLFASIGIVLVADSYVEAVAFAVLFGMAAGMRNIVETLLFANYFGRQSLGTIRGFAAPFRAISPIGPLLAGFVHDKTHSYDVAFLVFLGVAAMMLVSMIAARPPARPPVSPGSQGRASGG